MEPRTTGKRIVSKGEYTAKLGTKATHSSLGVGLILLGGTALVISGIVFLFSGWNLAMHFNAAMLFNMVITGPILSKGGWGVLQGGLRTLREAADIDVGVPFTRANTADLPAPESLVRASEEPLQAQEAVLVRAATERGETHEEQLLRATTGERA